MNDLRKAIENRRTFYAIGKESPVTNDEIQNIVEHAVTYVPSAFNSQSSRVVVLFDDQHDKLWDITKEILRSITPEDHFAKTEEKINAFRNGYGTVLFYEDQDTIEGLQNQFPLYKDNFPVWSQQSSGMLQFAVWTMLEEKGLGASLQHYNPLIDEEVSKQWNISKRWKLIAQMPFGKPLSQPDDKDFISLKDRIKIFP